MKSRNVIYANLLNVIQQIGSEPEKFELSQDLCEQAIKYLKLIEAEKDDTIRFMMVLQLIHIYLSDEDIINIINELIAKDFIEPPKVQKMYERFPHSFSDWIITPYGLFKQPPSWEREPNEELAKLLQREFNQKYLEPELEGYHGDYPLRVLEYCIKENPREIIRKIGVLRLRKVAEELGISAALKIKDEDELISLMLLKLGFDLPPIITGLTIFILDIR